MFKTTILLLSFLVAPFSLELTDLEFEQKVFEQSNIVRELRRRPDLILDSNLTILAREHSKNMASKKVKVGHAGFPVRGRKAQNQFNFREIGENIWSGDAGYLPHEVVDHWMNSSGHRKNLLASKYKYCGIGVAYDEDGKIYVTQMLAN